MQVQTDVAIKQIRNARMKRDDTTMKYDDEGAVIDPISHNIQDRTMEKQLLRSSSIRKGGGAKPKLTRSRSDSGTLTGELGLQIYIAPDDGDDENKIRFDYCTDSHYHSIHPNVFAPASLMNVRRMGGECVYILFCSINLYRRCHKKNKKNARNILYI